MATQSIELGTTKVVTYDGSTVKQINLNGTGIWTEILPVQVNQFYGGEDGKPYVSIGYDGLYAYTHNGLNCMGKAMGSTYILTPLGDSSIDYVDDKIFHRVAVFNSSGGLTSQAVVCTSRGFYGGSPNYGIPAVWKYTVIGFNGGNFAYATAAGSDCCTTSGDSTAVSQVPWTCSQSRSRGLWYPTTDVNYSNGTWPAWKGWMTEGFGGAITYRGMRVNNGTVGLIF